MAQDDKGDRYERREQKKNRHGQIEHKHKKTSGRKRSQNGQETHKKHKGNRKEITGRNGQETEKQ